MYMYMHVLHKWLLYKLSSFTLMDHLSAWQEGRRVCSVLAVSMELVVWTASPQTVEGKEILCLQLNQNKGDT